MGRATSQVKLGQPASRHAGQSPNRGASHLGLANPVAALTHSSVQKPLLQIAGQSWCDSLPLGKCPLRWHSSPSSGSVLSESSAQTIWNHWGHTRMVSQLSHGPALGESGSPLCSPALQDAPSSPREGRGGGLDVFQSLA